MLVDFYHLVSSPLERVLPQVAEKVLAGGERLLIVGTEPLLKQLDHHLWNYAREAFLPHGTNDTPAPERQPILLSSAAEAQNGATHIAIVDGEWRNEALEFARTFYFFDESHIENARSSWRALKDGQGAECRYWKQNDSGKWVQGP